LLKAVLTNVVPVQEPSTAFWVFDTGFNIAWFVGSAAMGWLYDRSVPALVCFSFALQVAALPVLFFAGRLGRAQDRARVGVGWLLRRHRDTPDMSLRAV
jgi:predicted MFS family arabinose efflux permease